MLEIVCNGKVHYRRPHNHPDILELLKQMSEGKADGYSIRSASSNTAYTEIKPCTRLNDCSLVRIEGKCMGGDKCLVYNPA